MSNICKCRTPNYDAFNSRCMICGGFSDKSEVLITNTDKQLPAEAQGHDSDARPKAPSFDEMVDILKAKAGDVAEVFVPCAEDDPRACGSYTSVDGRSLCYVRESKVPVIHGPGWVKGAPKEDKPHYAKVPSQIYDNVTYKAIIIPKEKSGRWWAVGDGFAFDLASEEIIEYLDESGTPANDLQEAYNKLKYDFEELSYQHNSLEKLAIKYNEVYQEENKDLKAKGDKLALELRRCKGSMEVHPDYFTNGNIEFIDRVEGAKVALAEWSGEKEPGGVPTLRDDVLGFAEWAASIAYFDDEYHLWNFYEEGKSVDGQFRFTTKEFFELYKKGIEVKEDKL